MNQPSVTVEQLDTKIEELHELRQKKAEAESVVKEINKEIATMESEIVGYMVELGREDAPYQGKVATVSVSNVERVTMPKTLEDKEALFNWLRERNLFDQYATVNSNSLNSLFKAEKEIAVSEDPTQAMTFSLPGIEAPKIHQKLNFRKKTK